MPAASSDIVEISSLGECAKIHLFGATLISWESQGKERLFLSKKAFLDGSKPIRGGIPLVFPQFGPSEGRPFPLPQHGFARLMRWRIVNKNESNVLLECKSDDNPQITKDFPFSCTLRYFVEIENMELKMTATVINTSQSEFAFDWLFHSYLSADLSSAKIQIKDTKRFKDSDGKEILEKLFGIGQNATVNTDKDSCIEIIPHGLPDYVIWNPGNRLPADMEKGEEKNMLCVEVGSINPPGSNSIGAGQSMEFSQILRVRH